jgi:hypothetical protein
MGGSESKSVNAGRDTRNKRNKRNERIARNSETPARIEDFIAKRRGQLRKLGLNDAETDSIIQEDIDLLQNVTELENINKLILRFYDLKDEDRVTQPVGALHGFGVDGLYRMNTSGNNFDCLIHSFLTATCENFRKLEKPSKDEFANFFRRTIFLTLPVVQCYIDNTEDMRAVMEMQHRVATPRTYLTDTEIHLLAAQFRINILTAQGQAGLNRFGITNAENLDLPPACIPREEFRTTIGIYTNGNHFEALRDHGNRYLFSGRRVVDIIEGSDMAWQARRGHGRDNVNLAAAIAESLKSETVKSVKKPAMNRRAVANSLGMTVANLNAYTNDDLRLLIGGGKRRTRRRRA